jgi:hypothetical protein
MDALGTNKKIVKPMLFVQMLCQRKSKDMDQQSNPR